MDALEMGRFHLCVCEQAFCERQPIPLIDAACFRGLWTNQASIAPDFAHGKALFLRVASIPPDSVRGEVIFQRETSIAPCFEHGETSGRFTNAGWSCEARAGECDKRGDVRFANVVAGS